MTADEVLALCAPPYRWTTQGWVVACPAHDDQRPSLVVSEGECGRVLVHCRAGCTTVAVCRALGIQVADLFADRPTPAKLSALPRLPRLTTGKHLSRLALEYELAGVVAEAEAEAVLGQRTGEGEFDRLTPEEVDCAWRVIGRAYQKRERAELFFWMADRLRLRLYEQRTRGKRGTS
jgi:hypothetical protein